MKRDMDCVREILLKIEDAKDAAELKDLLPPQYTPEDRDNTTYHLGLLRGAGFIVASVYPTMTDELWSNIKLTWDGHEFLDNTRDPEVWKKTKAGAAKVGGAGWDIVVGLAKEYVKQEVKAKLGISL